jgi:hypothetical protein
VTDEEKAVIQHRLARAREAFQEAELLLNTGHVNTCVSRLYYACYYAVSALLLTRGISAGKHSQVRALLHQQFVKGGILSRDMGRHFDRLFDSRQKSDYADFAAFNADDVAAWTVETRAFVADVDALVQRWLHEPADGNCQ